MSDWLPRFRSQLRHLEPKAQELLSELADRVAALERREAPVLVVPDSDGDPLD